MVFIHDVVTARLEFAALAQVATGLALPDADAPLLRLVETAPPVKLFIRIEALLLAAAARFLGGLGCLVAPLAPIAVTMESGAAVLMLTGDDAKVDTPDAVDVVMDVSREREPLVFAFWSATEVTEASSNDCAEHRADCSELISLQFVSWCIPALCRPCCCCCSSVVVPT